MRNAYVAAALLRLRSSNRMGLGIELAFQTSLVHLIGILLAASTSPLQEEQGSEVIELQPSCEYWQRRMWTRIRASGRNHVTCGKPWADHGEMGECPGRIGNAN